jgi:hypothetical protein
MLDCAEVIHRLRSRGYIVLDCKLNSISTVFGPEFEVVLWQHPKPRNMGAFYRKVIPLGLVCSGYGWRGTTDFVTIHGPYQRMAG